MANYKLIVADTTNSAYSKMTALVAQHLAVSFGYPLQNFKPTASQVIVFDPNTKIVNLAVRDSINCETSKVYTADSLINEFENPKVLCRTVVSDCGKVKAKIYTSGVEFATVSQMSISVFVPKDFLLKVVKNTGDRPNLPRVTFSYSGASRYVRVTRFDEDYLQGFEVYDDGSESFKKFCSSKISYLTLVQFIQS